MDVEITLQNYRCFGDKPVNLRVGAGFTALVGMNNAGKSSLLRSVYELRNLFAGMRQNGWNTIAGHNDANWFSPLIPQGERIFRANTEKPVRIEIRVHDSPHGPFQWGPGEQPITTRFELHRTGQLTAKLIADGQPVPMQAANTLSNVEPLLSACDFLANALYIGSFRNAISSGADQAYYDLRIGTGFVSGFAQFKSGADPVQNEAVVDLIDEIQRIFNFDSLDINPAPDGTTLQVTVNKRSYRLNELGAGISHFIVVLVNALVRKPSLILIDEPELNLHASLQLDFLSALARTSPGGVVFATHSLGLARSSAETVLLVSSTDKGSVASNYEEFPDLPSLAAQLGFDGRPELGYEKVLLVEGKSEVRAIMQFLRLYGKERTVALVPLGGGDLIHQDSSVELIELKRLGEVHYLIDSERSSEGADPSPRHAAFASLCEELGISGHMLERRALENYFEQQHLDAAFGPGHSALGVYERMSKGSGWSKSRNWQVAANVKKDELDTTDLGTFLSTL